MAGYMHNVPSVKVSFNVRRLGGNFSQVFEVYQGSAIPDAEDDQRPCGCSPSESLRSNATPPDELWIHFSFGVRPSGLSDVRCSDCHHHTLVASNELFEILQLASVGKSVEALNKIEEFIKPIEDEIKTMKKSSKTNIGGLYLSTIQLCYGMIFTQNGGYYLLLGKLEAGDNQGFIRYLLNFLDNETLKVDEVVLTQPMVHRFLQIVLIQTTPRNKIINYFGDPDRTIGHFAEIDNGFLFDFLRLWYDSETTVNDIRKQR